MKKAGKAPNAIFPRVIVAWQTALGMVNVFGVLVIASPVGKVKAATNQTAKIQLVLSTVRAYTANVIAKQAGKDLVVTSLTSKCINVFLHVQTMAFTILKAQNVCVIDIGRDRIAPKVTKKQRFFAEFCIMPSFSTL